MFSSGPNYQKLKTNLRLAVNRLKLLEKKKTELALKARKEIADYIGDGKIERAKIRVEHIIREDYIVEAMEIVEMYCDLLLARFGLLQQMKELDGGLAEAISSLIWVSPRLQSDAAELKLIGDQLIVKYGKPYGLACVENSVGTVSAKLMQKMSVQAPPKVLVEKYLIEIANNYNVNYEPDQKILNEAEVADNLIELGEGGRNNLDGNSGGAAGGSGGGGGGSGGNAQPMPAPGFQYPYTPSDNPANPPYKPFQYPNLPHESKVPLDSEFTPIPMEPFSPMNIPPPSAGFGTGFAPPHNDKELNFNFKGDGVFDADRVYFEQFGSFPPPYSSVPPSAPQRHVQEDAKPKPAPRKLTPESSEEINFPDLPDLPAVPSANPSGTDITQPSNSKPKPNNDSVENDEDVDLYGDLEDIIFSRADDDQHPSPLTLATRAEYEQKIAELQSRVDGIDAVCAEIDSRGKLLVAENQMLYSNASHLYEAARFEIEKKNKIIADYHIKIGHYIRRNPPSDIELKGLFKSCLESIQSTQLGSNSIEKVFCKWREMKREARKKFHRKFSKEKKPASDSRSKSETSTGYDRRSHERGSHRCNEGRDRKFRSDSKSKSGTSTGYDRKSHEGGSHRRNEGRDRKFRSDSRSKSETSTGYDRRSHERGSHRRNEGRDRKFRRDNMSFYFETQQSETNKRNKADFIKHFSKKK